MESLDLRGYDLVLSSSSAWAHGVHPDRARGARLLLPQPVPLRVERARGDARRPRPARPRRARPDLPALAAVGLDRRAARGRLRRELRDDARGGWRATSGARRPCCTRRSRPAGSRPGPVGDAYVVLSELMPHKRIDVAIRAFNDAAPAARRDRQRARTTGACAAWPGRRSRFTGRVSDAEAAALLSRRRGRSSSPRPRSSGSPPSRRRPPGGRSSRWPTAGVRETVLEGVTGTFYASARPAPARRRGARASTPLAVDPRRVRGERRALRRRATSATGCARSSTGRSRASGAPDRPDAGRRAGRPASCGRP